jgi:hypothetical protein
VEEVAHTKPRSSAAWVKWMETMIITVALPIIVVVTFGAVSVLLVGVVGGPIKTETPIVMTVFHIVAFLLWASDWSRAPFFTYVALLLSCVVVQVLVAMDLFKAHEKRLPDWLARALLVAAYLGFILVIVMQAEPV